MATTSAPAPAPVSIRPERPDQPEVRALLQALDDYLASLYPPEANHLLDVQALLGDAVHFLVARQQGVAVGCGAFRRMPADGDARSAAGQRPYGEIKRLYVSPAARGSGLGARLMESLEATLRTEGFTQALLETGEAKHEAMRLYLSAGYQRCGPFGGYPDNGLSVFLHKALA